MKTNTKTILLFIMSFALIGFISFTYAYFSNDIVNSNVKDQVVETGTLSLRYVDGPEINMQNIKPGSTITKTIYVANTGTLDAKYNLVWQELANEIINDEMVIEASCTRMNGQSEEVDGTCEGLTEIPIKRIKIKENVSIEPSIVHKYDITITFKEMNKDQNYNQGKTFSGVLGVKEYKAPKTVYCTFDGELTPGAEYTYGQYTYRYKQEAYYHYMDIMGYFLEWNDITEDGWGVTVSDTMNYEHITSEMCTFINNKPVVSMAYMFGTSSAKSIDLDSFDTSHVTNMSNVFMGSQASVLDVSNFDTSNVTDMSGMFTSFSTSIDLSNFNTSKVSNMAEMFMSSRATLLDLSSFDTSKVTDMSEMFSWSSPVSINLSSFNTSNVTDMNRMFYTSAADILDLSNFDTSNVTNMGWMFYNCENLKTIYASNKFVTTNVTSDSDMFIYSSNLIGGAGTVYDANNVDKTYARIDGGTSLPGYFTLK